VPLCEGKLKISLKVQLKDAVTKAVQSVTCDVFVIGEEPQVICHFFFQQQYHSHTHTHTHTHIHTHSIKSKTLCAYGHLARITRKCHVHLFMFICVCVSHKFFFCSVYELTQWSIVFLEKLTDSQPVKKFPAFYGT